MQEVTTSRHECAAADIGGVQSHSSTAGRSGRSEAIVCAAPIGVHATRHPGIPRECGPEVGREVRQARRRVGVENFHDDVARGQNSSIVHLDVHAINLAPLRIPVFERRFEGEIVDSAATGIW